MKTLVIDNFKGSMSSYTNGDMNSGFSNVIEQSGHDPFTKPGQLTWNEDPVQIDAAGAVITDLILDGKSRVESGIVYVYAIGHTGRLYKIQVNNPATYNPNYDNPVLLATLSAETPTFTRGGFIEFYGATERIYIGHDKGVTRIDFDGTNEAFVGVLGSWTQNVPRPFEQFLGNLYIGNGTNIAEINSTATVTTYTKLAPAFPIGSQLRDIDVVPDGIYLQMVVSKTALSDITSISPNTSLLSPSDSYVFKWNGTDTGYTSFVTYTSTILSSNAIFGNYNYTFGFDIYGGCIYNPIDKYLTSTTLSAYGESPLPNGVLPMGGVLSWATPITFDGVSNAMINYFGTISGYELEPGFFCPMFASATGTETDVNRMPCMILVSNFAQGTSSNGYTNTNFGSAKVYFSTLETSASPTTKYKFYKWTPAPTGLGTAATGGLYQTQTQLFSKKIRPTEVRVYGEPWVTNNSFIIDLIGSSTEPITNGSKTFTAGSNLTIGNDFAWYNPNCAPTYAIALRITNNGSANHTISKIEIDYTEGGK